MLSCFILKDAEDARNVLHSCQVWAKNDLTCAQQFMTFTLMSFAAYWHCHSFANIKRILAPSDHGPPLHLWHAFHWWCVLVTTVRNSVLSLLGHDDSCHYNISHSSVQDVLIHLLSSFLLLGGMCSRSDCSFHLPCSCCGSILCSL